MRVAGACVRLALLLLAGIAVAAEGGKATKPAKDPGAETRRALREEILQHFTLGVCAPVEWLKETAEQNGARWKFRQQYFSGGVNKPDDGWAMVFQNPWNKWVNPEKVKGVWGERWLKDTIDAGYVPWITYYNLAQSLPADYKPGPAKATPVNGRNTATMKAYWEDVRLLMQICARFAPKPVLVHIEPDEWGHLLLTARKGDELFPREVDVKVGSTGLEELKGLPDDMTGYVQAWLTLRDRHAPTNVLLGCNPSAWDERHTMTGARWASYLTACGAERMDFAVAEFGDRDLGAQKKSPPYTTDQIVVHLDTWDEQLRWIDEIHRGTGLWVWYWQVPVGNTWFSSCNQTDGHYCDGVVQLLLEDYPRNDAVARYVKAGCAGFVFNCGQSFGTHPFDAKKDGVTNPKPIPGTLGHTAAFADDDGGYLRLRGAAYSKKPYPILAKATPAKDKERAAPVAAAKPPPTYAPSAEAQATWRAALKTRLIEAVAAGKRPTFEHSGLRSQVRVDQHADGSFVLTMSGSDSGLTLDLFRNLAAGDAKRIAAAVARNANAHDAAICAFFHLADGDPQGHVWLSQAGEHQQAVRDALGAPPDAAPTASPSATGAAPASP